jgi:hypothetical protein
MAKLDAEVRKALGLSHGPAHPAAAATPTNGSPARVTTMPSAPPEPVKVPVAAKR